MYYVCMEESTFNNAETINFVPVRKEKKESENFKVLDILVVFSAIVVVVMLGLLAINPSKEASEARNLKRSADVSSILSFVSSYTNQKGVIPEAIPKSAVCVDFGNEICKSGPYDCTDLVDMSFLQGSNSDELVTMPEDPLYVSINGVGYYISQNEKYVTVCAPHAERNEKISFSKLMY